MKYDCMKQSVIVIGLGEVGRPLYELIQEAGRFSVFAVDLDACKCHGAKADVPPACHVDIMHLCIPCLTGPNYAKIALEYYERYTPRLMIVNSSVTPGTTQQIAERINSRYNLKFIKCLVAYSPIRGMPKNDMKIELMRWTKYVAGYTPRAASAAVRHFQQIGLRTKIVSSTVTLEFAKLFETTYRACMIASFQEMHRMCSTWNVSLNEAIDMIADVDAHDHNKPVHYPGVIGGTCLMPNVELLQQAYPSDLLKFVVRSNEERKREIRNSEVAEEVKKVRDRVERRQ